MKTTDTDSRDISRRGFVGACAAGAAAMGLTALTSCSVGKASKSSSSSTSSSDTAADDGYSAIEPLSAPASWDNEVDVVVAGTGGGLAAALRCAELNAKVMAFDPAASWGGSSKETDIFAIMGTQYQSQLWEQIDLTDAGMPGVTLAQMVDQQMGGHSPELMKQVLINQYLPYPGGSVLSAGGISTTNADGSKTTVPAQVQGHMNVVTALVNAAANEMDWMIEKIAPYGVKMGPVTQYGTTGMLFLCPTGAEAGGFVARTNYTAYEALYKASVDAGVEFSFNNGITGLVTNNDGAVIGVQSADGKYTKANKGVILATGGFSSNKAMLERYCPAVAKGSFTSTSTMNDDGSGIRMGLGVGADIDGLDSANCFDGGLQTSTFNHYLYKGDVQWARNVPSLFNIRGERVQWFSLNSIGFTESANSHLGQPGGYSIAVADSDNYEKIMDESTEPICRKPITPEMMAVAGSNADRLPEAVCEHDWHEGFQQGLDGGWIVKANTVEELADALGVDAENLQKGIDSWNAVCDAGVDEEMGLSPKLLRPIKTAPFYACKINGTILNTFCGLTCDFETGQVVNEAGEAIPGLYAGGTTMGGESGSCSGSATRNPGGGASFALGTCWLAANSVMGV